MVDNAFPSSSLPDQQGYYRNLQPPSVAYYSSPQVVYCPENSLVNDQDGSLVDQAATEQWWYPEEQNQHQQISHFHQTTPARTNIYRNFNKEQGQYNPVQQQTLGMQQQQQLLQQKNPIRSPPTQQQTCVGSSWNGGIEGSEEHSPASGWDEDIDNDILLFPSSSSSSSSSLPGHSSTTTIMDYNTASEDSERENNILQESVLNKRSVTSTKKSGGVHKSNSDVGKVESLYDLYCLHCDNEKQDNNGKGIVNIHDSVDEENTAAADSHWLGSHRRTTAINGDGQIIMAKQQQSVNENEALSLAAAYRRAVGVNISNNYPSYETIGEEASKFVERPPSPPNQSDHDIVNEESPFHYGSPSVIRRDATQLAAATVISGDNAVVNLSDNWWPSGDERYDTPQPVNKQRMKQQHDHDGTPLYYPEMNAPVSPGCAYTEPHGGREGNGGERGLSSSMIGQGWEDIDVDADQVSVLLETETEIPTSTMEQSPLEGKQLHREDYNVLQCCNDSSIGDFEKISSHPRTNYHELQQQQKQKKGMKHNDAESDCIVVEKEELPSHPLRSAADITSSRISWNTRMNIVPHQLPEGANRSIPDVEGQ